MLFRSVDNQVTSYEYEPLRVPYADLDGNNRYLVPDFLIKYVDGSQALVEIRPAFRLANDFTLFKMVKLREYCNENGYAFVWVSDFMDRGKVFVERNLDSINKEV